jgi:uncharacterized protein YbjT (DUF2867 family)
METILVTGATGAQGGSVARHLLQQGNFNVRCLTRNPASEAALALQSKGAEIVKGDLSDKDTLSAAMEGCYGVFGVTNFWEHFGGEQQHGLNLVDAVEAANIEHFVFSTLPSAEQLSGGTLSVPHFETKAAMENYSRSKDLAATYVHPGFYFENFLSFFPPMKMENGAYGFGFPQGNTPLAAISIEDLGGIVNTIFNNPSKYIGQLIGAVSEDLSPTKYAETMTKVLNHTIKYNDIPREVFASFGFPGAEDLATMFTCNKLHILERKEDQKVSHEMYSGIKGFEQWLTENKEKFVSFFQEQTTAG